MNDCEAEADIELVDRLSELPDDVIQEILSFLPMREVVKTALLAKRWEDLWKTVPCFDFRYSAENDLDKFKSFIKQAVSLWRGAKIRKLSLSYMFDPLLRFAVEHQVEEVSIEETKRFEYYNEYEEEDYCIPQCVYSCSSITKITISPFESHILDNVRWNKLESLTLQGADVWIEDAMSQILSGCPRLEVLNLFMRETGSGSFIDIQSRSLKMLVIEMHAPRSSYYESKGQ